MKTAKVKRLQAAGWKVGNAEDFLGSSSLLAARVRGDQGAKSIADSPLSLEQRLAAYDPARHGGEVMATGGHAEPARKRTQR